MGPNRPWCAWVTGLVLGMACWGCGPAVSRFSAPQTPDAVDPRTGITVKFTPGPGTFPLGWESAEVGAKATPLDKREVDRSFRIVQRALERYPVSLLKKHLQKVYVLGSLEFFGVGYGGTYSTDTVYLADQGAGWGYTDDYLEGGFHHEFSSILMVQHAADFDSEAFARANPQGFRYQGDGIDAVKEHKDSILFDEASAKDGFLTQYSRASVEEDFNMLAEGLFLGMPEFWKLVDTNPRLKKKAAVVVAFYHRLDPGFTEEAFRNHRRRPSASAVPQ